MIDIWEVRITAPDGSYATKLVTDTMVKLSVACAGLNDYATAASLAVYDFATLQMEALDADTEGKTDQPNGQHAGQDQAQRPGEG